MVAALLAMFGTITRSFRLAPVKCALHMSTIFSVIVPSPPGLWISRLICSAPVIELSTASIFGISEICMLVLACPNRITSAIRRLVLWYLSLRDCSISVMSFWRFSNIEFVKNRHEGRRA